MSGASWREHFDGQGDWPAEFVEPEGASERPRMMDERKPPMTARERERAREQKA